MAEKVYEEIKKLPEESEFTIQQFIKDYNILEKHKFLLCDQVLEFCEKNNVKVLEKIPEVTSGLLWNILRIKK